MTADQYALFATVDTVHGLMVYGVCMLLALTIGRMRAGTPAVRKVPRRR
jgi:hypothetical protein